MSVPERLHIIGGPGSGKSYLAERISEEFGHAHVDLDRLCWNDDFSVKTDRAERRRHLQDIVEGDRWVVEGAYCASWVQPSFEAADTILSLQISPLLQRVRLARRLSRRMVQGKASISGSLELLRWVDGFNESLESLQADYDEKVVRLVGRTGINAYLATVAEHLDGEAFVGFRGTVPGTRWSCELIGDHPECARPSSEGEADPQPDSSQVTLH